MAPAERFSAFYCLQSLPEVTHLQECLHRQTVAKRYFTSANLAFCAAEEEVLKHLSAGSCFCQGKGWARPHRFVHKEKSHWPGQSCRVFSQSPLAMQLLKMSEGTVAAKGGCLSREPKCPSYYAKPAKVCYRQSYFQMRLFLKDSLMKSCCSQNTCTTSSSGSVCCTTWFQNQKRCIKVLEEKEKQIVIIPSLLRWGTIKQFQHFRKMSAEFQSLSCNNLN